MSFFFFTHTEEFNFDSVNDLFVSMPWTWVSSPTQIMMRPERVNVTSRAGRIWTLGVKVLKPLWPFYSGTNGTKSYYSKDKNKNSSPSKPPASQNGLGKWNWRNSTDIFIYDNKKTRDPKKKMPRCEKGYRTPPCCWMASETLQETSTFQAFVGSFAHSSNSIRSWEIAGAA